MMKPTVKNIANLWFGADTPIRQYKVKLHPHLWDACQKAYRHFKAPSGAAQIDSYRKSDKMAFAKYALSELQQTSH